MTPTRRVATAIDLLARRWREPPSLEEAAAAVELSPHHFQRLFRRMTGVSPKRFVQSLRADHAERMLCRSSPLLETAYECGLSGPGRLHDLTVSVRAMTPGQIRRGGEGLRIDWDVQPTPLGDCLLARTERGICELAFVDPSLAEPSAVDSSEVERSVVDPSSLGRSVVGRPVVERSVVERSAVEQPVIERSSVTERRDLEAELAARWPRAVRRRAPGRVAPVLARLFDSGERPGPLTLHLRGTNFQIRVWKALLAIPAGRVTSYGALAASVGRPTAARAVGQAVGANPVAVIIPCHRVLRAAGALGGYRWGPDRKRALLAFEAAAEGCSGS